MRIKSGVQLAGVQPEMILALLIIEPILKDEGQELVITSCTDSLHSHMSRHYIGYGLDIRSRDIPKDLIEEVARKMSLALGSEYYVKFEVHHYHIQFNGSPRH